jgi:endonuclease YncB( thermonuclease family)
LKKLRHRPTSRKALAAVAWLLLSPLALGQGLTGRVVGVHDGDTLTLLTAEEKRVSVRLADIDAPELGQPFGRAAKRELSDLCFGRAASIEARTVDRYGRTVGVVSCEGNDASRLMVERGMAWVYRRYLRRPELVDLEEVTRGKYVGLWSQPAVPPWEYRKRIKAVAVAVDSESDQRR